mmetsp:Transcript_23565/g.54815  ORF Transcript_23565/g.54815 Transcript_23565/m.54815 type:complete len:200 (+) Transcript_23565:50-649(+)
MKMRSHSALTAFALVFLQGIYCFHLQPSHNGLLRCFHRRRCTAIKASVVPGPPQETKPDYENIHGPLGADMDKLFMRVFRSKMVEQVGFDSSLPQDDYSGLMELAAALNARYSNREEVQKRAQAVLCALFPSWMPGSYAKLFSKPFPEVCSLPWLLLLLLFYIVLGFSLRSEVVLLPDECMGNVGGWNMVDGRMRSQRR